MKWLDLSNEKGDRLQIELLGFGPKKAFHHSVLIKILGKTAEYEWQKEYPCFYDSELNDLADWLVDLAQTPQGDIPPLQFHDPSMIFVAQCCAGENRCMQILLLGDLHPQGWASDEELIFCFPVRQETLLQLSATLREYGKTLFA